MGFFEAFPWLLSYLPLLFAAWLRFEKGGRHGLLPGSRRDYIEYFSYEVPLAMHRSLVILPSTEYLCSSGTEVLPCVLLVRLNCCCIFPCPFLLIPQTCPGNRIPTLYPILCNSKASEVLVCTSHAQSAKQPYSIQKAVAAAPHQVQI